MDWVNSSGGIFLRITDTSLASLFSFSFSIRSTSVCSESRTTWLTFIPYLESFFLSSAGTLAHTVSSSAICITKIVLLNGIIRVFLK